MVVFMILVIIILAVLAIPHINKSNLINFNINKFFLPYGVVLFAFLATPAIPEINEELKNNKEVLKKAIIIGSLIPIFAYILFALTIAGVTGTNTTEDAIIGLSKILGYKAIMIGSIFGILTMATSFIAVAFAITEMYHFDYRLKRNTSAILACFIPLIIALVMIHSKIEYAFFKVLDISGSFGGSLGGILIVFMWLKAKKAGNRKPEYNINTRKMINILLILMLLFGIILKIYEIFLA